MKKRNVLNLIKNHIENNDAMFREEALEIARFFNSNGDKEIASYIISLLSGQRDFVPQNGQNRTDINFLEEVDIENLRTMINLPDAIMRQVQGVMNAIQRNVGVNKFMLEGHPGTGKTQSVLQIARILKMRLLSVNFSELVDSKLGQTSKNIINLFHEINHIAKEGKVMFLLDEIDSIAMDRVNANDIREMGRVTSTFLKGIDSLESNVILFATTNLFSNFDKALIRRFDTSINFDVYTKEDLVFIAEQILNIEINKFENLSRNKKLFKKIFNKMDDILYPGELHNYIKRHLAFSDLNDNFGYLKSIFEEVYKDDIEKLEEEKLIKLLNKEGFTLREMEILLNKPKTTLNRIAKGGDYTNE